MDSSTMRDFRHRKIALAPSNPCWALAFLGPEKGTDCPLPFLQTQQTARELFFSEKTEKKQIPCLRQAGSSHGSSEWHRHGDERAERHEPFSGLGKSRHKNRYKGIAE
jgi:hypothetical protein